jgi:hypothetical protein
VVLLLPHECGWYDDNADDVTGIDHAKRVTERDKRDEYSILQLTHKNDGRFYARKSFQSRHHLTPPHDESQFTLTGAIM